MSHSPFLFVCSNLKGSLKTYLPFRTSVRVLLQVLLLILLPLRLVLSTRMSGLYSTIQS